MPNVATTTIKHARRNWLSTLLGVGMAVAGGVAAANKPTIGAAVRDPTIQMSVLASVLGIIAKDFTGSTPEPPADPPK